MGGAETHMSAREPVLNPVRIKSLRPTQMTLGLREVDEKRRIWRERGGDKGAEYLGRHMIPVVLGPTHTLPMGEDDPYDRSYTTPAALYKAGVKFCIGTFSSRSTTSGDAADPGKRKALTCRADGFCSQMDGEEAGRCPAPIARVRDKCAGDFQRALLRWGCRCCRPRSTRCHWQ